MTDFSTMYDTVEELIIEGDFGHTELPLSAERSCELAVECWQLRRDLHDRKKKQLEAEQFSLKLQKDVVRLTHNVSLQRGLIKEKDEEIFKLSNTILDQNKKITDLDVSLNGVSGTLRRKKSDIEKISKQHKALQEEFNSYKERT